MTSEDAQWAYDHGGGADHNKPRPRPHYIITVDQAAIRMELPAIHVHSLDLDLRANAREVELTGARIVQGPMRQDGSRVWIEAVDVRVVQ